MKEKKCQHDFQNTRSVFKKSFCDCAYHLYESSLKYNKLSYKLNLVAINNIINIPQMLMNSSEDLYLYSFPCYSF